MAEIEYNPQGAVSFTRNLSDVYRYILACQDKRLVGLREEMEFVDTYVELHRVRLGDCLTVDWQVDEAVREDAQLLYGFSTKAERELFRLLISVSGVGGNTARMILSTYSPRELQGIITAGNAVLLKNVKGLGLKTAQKIIVELSGKLMAPGADDGGTQPGAGGSFDEALAALSMLGFARAPAEKVLRGVLRESPAAPVEELIRMALKKL